jgi:hypothetical protein
MSVYKILDTKRGLYYCGQGRWTEGGKVYRTLGFVRRSYGRCSDPRYHDGIVVEEWETKLVASIAIVDVCQP